MAAAVDADRGVVLEAPNLGWRDLPLAQRARERLGCPVAVENDVNAAVLGELSAGAIRGEPEALGVWIGTGIGGAIVLGGALHRGGLGTAGEIGHTTLLPGAPAGLSKFEETCSRSAIADRLARLARTRQTALRADLDAGPVRASAIARAYAAGDALTREVVDEAADLIGVGIASAVTLLGMPVALLGGGLVEALGEPFVDAVAASARRRVFPAPARGVDFRITMLRERAGILGAAARARQTVNPRGLRP
ncbi:MAG: ROK family protein [Planctomycetota bacterium]|nr:MAG: ROK family protein [Planctomycetota bacterium]